MSSLGRVLATMEPLYEILYRKFTAVVQLELRRSTFWMGEVLVGCSRLAGELPHGLHLALPGATPSIRGWSGVPYHAATRTWPPCPLARPSRGP